MEKDIAVGVLGAALALAGLLLVFCGFLFSKADGMTNTKRAGRFVTFARLGVVPLILSFAVSWVCVMAIQGSPWAIEHGLLLFKVSLVVSAAYSIIALLII